METIRKKVNLNDAIIRLSGCTVPYIGVSDDSLGKIYCDISGSTYVRMKTVARAYNRILNIIRDGVKLNRKSNLSSCVGQGSESKYVLAEDFNIMSGMTCPNPMPYYTVYSFDSFDRVSDTEYETHLPGVTAQTVVLIDNYEDFETLGGINRLTKCYKYLFCRETDGGTYVTPYIEMPLALNQDIADLGHMTDYQDEWNEFPNEDGISTDIALYSGDTKDYPKILNEATYKENNDFYDSDDEITGWPSFGKRKIPTPVKLTGSTKEVQGYTTDSKLQFLRSKKLYTDDDGNLLPGLFVENEYCKEHGPCKYTYSNGEWVSGETEAHTICGDGLSNGECVVTATTQMPKYYRTVSLDAVVQKILSGVTSGTYYFYVKYKNDKTNPMTIPFAPGVVDGNGISNISYDSDFVTFEYFYNDIQYKETYKYNPSVSAETTLDGFENITIYYNEIDYDFTEQTIYNKHYDLYREGNLADIVQYREGHVWCDDDSNDYVASAETINAPIFKEEYLLGISSTFKADVNVTINRGNAAAFERHFKLSECNTMEDLENYGNNIFNL